MRFDVTLVGEANFDLLLYGLPEALPPERELLADKIAMLLGGSPAITARTIWSHWAAVWASLLRTQMIFSQASALTSLLLRESICPAWCVRLRVLLLGLPYFCNTRHPA